MGTYTLDMNSAANTELLLDAAAMDYKAKLAAAVAALEALKASATNWEKVSNDSETAMDDAIWAADQKGEEGMDEVAKLEEAQVSINDHRRNVDPGATYDDDIQGMIDTLKG